MSTRSRSRTHTPQSMRCKQGLETAPAGGYLSCFDPWPECSAVVGCAVSWRAINQGERGSSAVRPHLSASTVETPQMLLLVGFEERCHHCKVCICMCVCTYFIFSLLLCKCPCLIGLFIWWPRGKMVLKLRNFNFTIKIVMQYINNNNDD